MWLQRLYGWACERLYAEFANSYDWVSWLVSLGGWSAWQALALDYVQGARVLEIGFGTGNLLLRLVAHGVQPVGLELSPAMQQQTTCKLRSAGVSAPRLQARAQAMPFATGQFDTIIATFPAPYILDYATLQECGRLLTSTTAAGSGRLVIVGLWVALAAQHWEWLIPLFYGRPSPAALAQLALRFQAAGLQAQLLERTVGWATVGIVIAEPTRSAA